MDSAEQAALSESERDAAQVQSQTAYRHFDHRHLNEYYSDDARDQTPRPMRRFENLVVNLTHSSVLMPAGAELSGARKLAPALNGPISMVFVVVAFLCRAECTFIDCLVTAFGSDFRE